MKDREIGDDKRRDENSIMESSKFSSFNIKKGEWRKALILMAERIMSERQDDGAEKPGHHPEPKNPIWRAAYKFLKCCESGDVNFIKELANRLDGLPAQSITVDDKRSLEELSDAELAAAAEALTAILAAQNSAAGASAAGEVKPAG